MIAKPCLDGFLQESTFRINLSLKFNLVTILHQKGERLWKKNKKMLAEQSGSETWGNLLEVENVFCSKNLISRVLSHIAFRKRNSKAEDYAKLLS